MASGRWGGPAPEPTLGSCIRRHEALVHKVCHSYTHAEEDRHHLYPEVLLQIQRALPRSLNLGRPAWVTGYFQWLETNSSVSGSPPCRIR